MPDSKKKILIIEDDRALSQALEAKFLHEGFDVSLAYDGKEGLIKANEVRPGAILLDIMMPEMDGIESYYHIDKALGYKLPVIIMTNKDAVTYPDSVTEVIFKTKTSIDEIVKKVKEHLGAFNLVS